MTYSDETEVVEPSGRSRAVRAVCAVISAVTALFALVLALHILLVLFEANPANSFADFVERSSAAVSLGLRGLFTPADPKIQVLLNDGLAAILWLVIGGVLTALIRRVAGGGLRYHRTVR